MEKGAAQRFGPGSQWKCKRTVCCNRRPWFLAIVADKFPRTKGSDSSAFLTLVCYYELRPTGSQLNVVVRVINSNQLLAFCINITAAKVILKDAPKLHWLAKTKIINNTDHGIITNSLSQPSMYKSPSILPYLSICMKHNPNIVPP
jgi:hypothetical protein